MRVSHLQCATSLLAGNYEQKLDYSFLYLLDVENHFSATEDVVVHLDIFWISAAQ